MSLIDIMGKVAAERARQVEKWGEQNHPDLCPSFDREGDFAAGEGEFCLELGIQPAEDYKQYNAELAANKELYWYAILMEEVAEAHEQAVLSNGELQIKELIEVMAVCAAQIDCIQRRNK